MKHWLLLFSLLVFSALPAQNKPELFVLAVGVETYNDARLNLNFCADDARDVAAAFKKQTALYDVMEVKVLTDEQATRAAVREELDRFAQLVTGDDLFVFFFSGHGFEDALIPYDFNIRDRFATSITKEDFKDKLGTLGCNYMVLLDACFSGSFTKNAQSKTLPDEVVNTSVELALKRLAEALADTDKNAMIFTSSSSNQESWECPSCGHGYFAQTVLDCIDGKSFQDPKLNRSIGPEADGSGILGSLAFEKYMSEAVRIRTAELGVPQKVRVFRSTGGDFPVLKVAVIGTSVSTLAPPIQIQSSNSDRDYDGVPDAKDECPTAYGTLNGCPDTDNDGIPDHRDVCPYEKGTASENGCPVRDRDNDGVVDGADKCPDKKGPKEWQGCPDSDKDGVPDHKDECPIDQGPVSNLGCPNEKENDVFENVLAGSFVFVKGGTFNMGSNKGDEDEKPIHAVELNDFFIGQTEVTQAQWRAVMGNNPSFEKDCSMCPVEKVSWIDIQSFIQKLNELSGHSAYRLPTEAEWEYAARGGSLSNRFTYAGGQEVDKVAVYNLTSIGRVQHIKKRAPNELGLYDMSGNVAEWCSDWFGPYLPNAQINPVGPVEGVSRVIRGGSWSVGPDKVRITYRDNYSPEVRYATLGFRLARFVSQR